MNTPALKTTAATGPVAAAITRCMEAYFPQPRPALKTYRVSLLIADHLVEDFDVTAHNAVAAIAKAVDLRRTTAIRAGRPRLPIAPWAITKCRLATV